MEARIILSKVFWFGISWLKAFLPVSGQSLLFAKVMVLFWGDEIGFGKGIFGSRAISLYRRFCLVERSIFF